MLQELVQEIENTARSVTRDMHTALPGIIKAFDASKGTVSVLPVGKFTTADGFKIDYPLLTDVPIVFPFSKTANAGIAFPITVGDDCIVIFSEIELDAWRSGSESTSQLHFDLSNGVCIPGLFAKNNSAMQKAVSRKGVVIASGGREVIVGSTIEINGNVKINGNLSVDGTIKASGEVKGNTGV